MAMAEIRRFRLLEEENRKFKQLVADLTLEKVMLQEVLTTKRSSLHASGNGYDAWCARARSVSEPRAGSCGAIDRSGCIERISATIQPFESGCWSWRKPAHALAMPGCLGCSGAKAGWSTKSGCIGFIGMKGWPCGSHTGENGRVISEWCPHCRTESMSGGVWMLWPTPCSMDGAFEPSPSSITGVGTVHSLRWIS